jgi:UDP-N-acetylmuramoyl-tripeptide--D-alanyl-D-alanine ligase
VNIVRDRALAATGARVLNGHLLPPEFRIALDTRTLLPGDTYVALRGERFDGHTFAATALQGGAVALLVEDAAAVPDGVPALVVGDTRAALLALGGEARRAIRAKVVAITGSTGKTTTKDLLAQLLRASGRRVAATHQNENNEIGVAKLLLGLEPDVDAVVVEFGARHYGDILPLVAAVKPTVAVLTNVGDAHLEIMGSPERLAETKWQVFSTGAQPVLNAADATTLERAENLREMPWWFAVTPDGSPERTPRVAVVEDPQSDGDWLVHAGRGAAAQRTTIDYRLPGAHNRHNVAAACAAAFAIGLAAGEVAAAIPGLSLPARRYERSRVAGFDVVFDAYNASMAGTIATLDAFARERGKRRIAVLAGMAELGAASAAMHERVGAAAAGSDLAALLVGGDYAADLERGARRAGLDPSRLVRFDRNGDAVRWLRANARAGDIVLLKGSRRYRLEEVVEGLRDAAG